MTYWISISKAFGRLWVLISHIDESFRILIRFHRIEECVVRFLTQDQFQLE